VAAPNMNDSVQTIRARRVMVAMLNENKRRTDNDAARKNQNQVFCLYSR
jgi:hypothetical protein